MSDVNDHNDMMAKKRAAHRPIQRTRSGVDDSVMRNMLSPRDAAMGVVEPGTLVATATAKTAAPAAGEKGRFQSYPATRSLTKPDTAAHVRPPSYDEPPLAAATAPPAAASTTAGGGKRRFQSPATASLMKPGTAIHVNTPSNDDPARLADATQTAAAPPAAASTTAAPAGGGKQRFQSNRGRMKPGTAIHVRTPSYDEPPLLAGSTHASSSSLGCNHNPTKQQPLHDKKLASVSRRGKRLQRNTSDLSRGSLSPCPKRVVTRGLSREGSKQKNGSNRDTTATASPTSPTTAGTTDIASLLSSSGDAALAPGGDAAGRATAPAPPTGAVAEVDVDVRADSSGKNAADADRRCSVSHQTYMEEKMVNVNTNASAAAVGFQDFTLVEATLVEEEHTATAAGDEEAAERNTSLGRNKRKDANSNNNETFLDDYHDEGAPPILVQAAHPTLVDSLHNRKTQYFILGLVLFIAAGFVATLMIALNFAGGSDGTTKTRTTESGGSDTKDTRNDETATPILAPTAVHENIFLHNSPSPAAVWQNLLPASTQEVIQNASSPQAAAYIWITSQNISLDIPEWILMQRFALATVYYSFTGNDDEYSWEDFWFPFINSADMDECKWENNGRVACNENGAISRLDMSFVPITQARSGITTVPNLTGSLPGEVGLLSSLTHLGISGTTLKTPVFDMVPPTLQMASHLTSLDLHQNQLRGTIPARSLATVLPQLENLQLWGNSLTGTVPDDLGLLRQLTALFTHDNGLFGEAPSDACGLSCLESPLKIDCDKMSCPTILCDCTCSAGTKGNSSLVSASSNVSQVGMSNATATNITSSPSSLSTTTLSPSAKLSSLQSPSPSSITPSTSPSTSLATKTLSPSTKLSALPSPFPSSTSISTRPIISSKSELEAAIDEWIATGRSTFGHTSEWDVSRADDFSHLFENRNDFNDDVSSWTTRQVTCMRKMFANAGSFNADISRWDTGRVTAMGSVFAGSSFNQDISSWNASSTAAMRSM